MASNEQRLIKGKGEGGGVVERIASAISESPIADKTRQVASDATFVANKLRKSTGKAMWYSGTWLLILAVPLIIAMDREQQLNELELQQASLLGTPTV